jgi:uncharacterized membrane protein YhhN
MFWNLIIIPVSMPVLALYVKARGKNDLGSVRIVQPLATFLATICAVLGLLSTREPPVYGVLVAIGLIVSSYADGLLIDIDDKSLVVTGSSIFSGALLLYSAAVVIKSGLSAINAYTGAAMLAVFVFIAIFLWKGAARLRAPVLLYSLIWCLTISAALAGLIGSRHGGAGSVLMLAGLASFFIADSLMSMNYFIHPMPKPLVAAFYGVGQLLIALSVGY